VAIKLIFFFIEILPLVEFELEDDITDEEAEKLIEEPLPSSDDATINDQFTVTSNEIDLFTVRLMKYEVISIIITFEHLKQLKYKF
jgi:intraflagellar transport protein 122